MLSWQALYWLICLSSAPWGLSRKASLFSLLSGSHYLSSILLLPVSACMGCLNTCMHALLQACTPSKQISHKTSQPSAITFETVSQNIPFFLKLSFFKYFCHRDRKLSDSSENPCCCSHMVQLCVHGRHVNVDIS